MKQIMASFAVGVVFALGLGIGGMTQADKVIGFLNVAGDWDPSLAFVMGGALVVHWVLFRLILKRESPLFGVKFGIPSRTDIDLRLIGGSALFGIGWAISGYCPGPGLVSLPAGSGQALSFVGALIVGMQTFHIVDAANKHRKATAKLPPRTRP